MKMNRANKGTIIANKLYGTFYVIRNVLEDVSGGRRAEAFRLNEGEYLSAFPFKDAEKDRLSFLSEVLPLERSPLDIPYMEGSMIVITDENAICFRVIKDSPEKISAEDWYVKDGTLMKNGVVSAEHGEIEVEKILAVFSNRLLLATKAAADGYFDLAFFYPGHVGTEFAMRDEYKAIPMPEKVELPGGKILLYYSKTHVEEEGEDNDKKSVEVIDKSGYLLYDSIGNIVAHCDTDDFIAAGNGPLGSYAAATENYILFQGVFNEKPFTHILKKGVMLKETDLAYSLVKATENVDNSLFIKTDAELAVVVPKKDNLVLKPSKQLKKVLKEIDGYDYLVDYNKGYNRFTLVLATSDYKVKTVKGSYTSEIGLVLSVD